MEFSVGTCAKIDQVDLVKKAEDLGFTHFGVGEGPLLFSDPYQQLALAAVQTSTIKLGTMVTNPATRIPPVTANSIATLNHLAPGRTFLGFGTANNAMRSMGRNPASMRELEHAIAVTRGLLRGERVTHRWRGEDREVAFLDDNGHWYAIDDVPIWVAVGGPKGIDVAARTADAIVFCLGPQVDMIKAVRRELDEAVARAGRAPGSVKLVSLSWFYLLRGGEDWLDAVNNGFGSGPISSCLSNLGLMHKYADALRPGIVEASEKAAMAYLGDPNAPQQPHYLDVWAKYLRGLDPQHASIITKELCDYWCLYGGPDDVLEQTQLMQEAGVDLVNVFLSNPFTAERDVADIGSAILARV